MRTVRQLPVAQVTDPLKFPQGTIQNETDTELGTPVIREIYGDVLTNIYAILADAGIVPDGVEDDELRGYQLLNALKRFSNELNDVEQVLSLNATVWSVNMPVDHLPNRYVFMARAAENYNDALSYTFTGTDNNSYPLTSPTGFRSGDDVLVVIDQAGVRVVGLTKSVGESTVLTVFGTPVAFNDSANMYYEDNGSLLTDAPSVEHLQARIRVVDGNGTLVVYNMFVLQGFVLCFCYLPSVQTYRFYHFDINDLDTPVLVPVTGVTIPTGSNNEPYAYTDGTLVYLTNQAGTSTDDFELAGLTYAPATPSLALSVSRVLPGTFTKTTNAVLQNTDLVTFINGQLKKYDLTTGIETQVDEYGTFIGTIFRFNGATYYSNGEVAKQWTV
jgi:hypothetical protein